MALRLASPLAYAKCHLLRGIKTEEPNLPELLTYSGGQTSVTRVAAHKDNAPRPNTLIHDAGAGAIARMPPPPSTHYCLHPSLLQQGSQRLHILAQSPNDLKTGEPQAHWKR